MSDFFYKHNKLFHSLQFEVIRNVCFSFVDHYVIPVESFNAALQIEDKKDVTVWISDWRGVGYDRVAFDAVGYGKFGRLHDENYFSMIKPSQRLLNDSQRYVQEVLGVDFYQYDAVVVRQIFHRRTIEWNVQHYNNCTSACDRKKIKIDQ